jgi:DnaD/phage-associated family protein
MGFFKQIVNLDLGEIAIENIFINDFMPAANGTFVKVYLLGYKYATDGTEVTNNTISKHLNIPLSDVINAWSFWKKKGIIKIHNTDENKLNFDVEFCSLRQLYIENNFSTKSKPVSEEIKYTRNTDVLLEMQKNDDIRKMFRELNEIIHRELQPNEKLKVLNLIERYNMDILVIIQAFHYSVEKKNNKNINYISAIIRNWYDDGIVTYKDLEDHFNKNSDRYKFYNSIYKTLGYNKLLVSAGDKELIDKWLDNYKLENDFILKIVTESTKKTSNINMNFVDKIVTTAYEKNINTIDELITNNNKEKKEKQKNYKKKKNAFHTFQKSKKEYTNDELEKILGIKE